MFITDKEALKLYQKEYRHWQGIPGIERTKGGRIFVTFYSGGETEGPGNFVLLKYSGDGGCTWTDIIAANHPEYPKRSFDPCLWIDPDGRLWWFWAQEEEIAFNGYAGVWYSRCDKPDDKELVWTEPVRFANGVMMNKPTVLKDGSWLMPCAIWRDGLDNNPHVAGLACERKSNIYISYNKGKTFTLYGQADVPNRSYDEHMVVELKDGRLLMLVRTIPGIGKSYSYDGGRHWTPSEDSGLGGPGSRFFIRRLKSGRILLVNHYHNTGRNNLTAMLSEDEGETWKGFLLIDGRDQVSYPDGTEDENGNIYIIYDRERYGAKEILIAKITEDDILAGKLITNSSRLQIVADKL